MSVYHVELRHFPRSVNRFNLSGTEVGAIVLPWVQEKHFEFGEQKWNPHEAKLTILQGPQLPVQRLAMGRGWRAALRESQDVTERVIAEATEALGDAVPAPLMMPRPADSASLDGTAGDPLVLLGAEPAALLARWHAVVARTSGLKPSESLALAEGELAAQDAATP